MDKVNIQLWKMNQEIKALAKEVKAEQEEKVREVQSEGLLVENYEEPA